MPKPYINPNFKKGDSKTIFTIHSMENPDGSYQSLHRTFGWYSSAMKAYKAVRNNECDIYENVYDYVVIEEVKEGTHGSAIKEWWFKWSKTKDEFLPISKPTETKGIVNWGIG